MPPIELNRSTRDFIDQVENLSHSPVSRCWHCLTCSGGCPFSQDMDYMPNAVIDSIARYGRTHKLEIMMRYKLASKDLFSDIDLGLKMMSRRKLDLMPSKVKDREAIRNIFKQNHTGR